MNCNVNYFLIMRVYLKLFTELKENTLLDNYETILWKSLNLTQDMFLMVPDFSFSDVSWKRLAKEPELH